MQREIELEQALNDVKTTNARLLRQLAEAKVAKEELVAAVYNAAKDGIDSLVLPPIKAPKADSRKKGEEVAVAVLSDWQLAKLTPDYNSDVCEERIELYGEKVLKLTDIQRSDHPVKELRVWLLGDIIEGELIFPGQQYLIDGSLYRQVTVDGPRILGNFLRKMAGAFEKVHVTAVIGNHGALGGRARRDYSPETNGDRMLYRIVQQILANEQRVTWTIPDGGGERNWYAVDDIGGYKTLLFHGDQVRGQSGLPWYGFHKKVLGWKVGAIPEGFDDAFCGHYHQPTRMTLNTVTVRVNGSTESYNTYAQEQLAAVGFPSQTLMFVNPGKGVTSEYTIWLN